MIRSLCNWQVPEKSAVLDKMRLMGLTQRMMGNQCVRNKIRFAFVNYVCLMADFLRYLHSVNVWFSAFSCCYFHKWSQNLIDIIHRMIFQGFKFHKPIVSTKFVEFKYLKTIYGSEHGGTYAVNYKVYSCSSSLRIKLGHNMNVHFQHSNIL